VTMIRRRSTYAIATVGALLAALTACGGDDDSGTTAEPSALEGRGPITYVAGKDSTGVVPKLIDAWNADHPDEEVTFIELSTDANEQRSQMIQNAQTESDAYTVLSVDVVWTSEFAANQWIEALPEDEFPLDENLDAINETGMYNDQLYAVPASSDGGLLYYRTDLLEAAGIDGPPETWDELKADCEKIQATPEGEGVECFAGQFEKYEGLTVNFAEAVNSSGGVITEADGTPNVDTPEALEGLTRLVDWFEDGTIPEEAITYQEEEGRQAFQAGKLIFHRQWPYQYGLANATDGSSKVAGKFDVAPLPGDGDNPGASSLGGHNDAISAFAENQATAVDFIKYMTSEESQRIAIEEASLAPSIESLYTDPQLVKDFPYLPALADSIDTAVPRPRVVPYGDVTEAIQDAAYGALTGETSPEDALAELQTNLEELTEQ